MTVSLEYSVKTDHVDATAQFFKNFVLLVNENFVVVIVVLYFNCHFFAGCLGISSFHTKIETKKYNFYYEQYCNLHKYLHLCKCSFTQHATKYITISRIGNTGQQIIRSHFDNFKFQYIEKFNLNLKQSYKTINYPRYEILNK